jgi:phage protein D
MRIFLKPGSEIEIQLGYHGDCQTVFKGIITKHAIKAKTGSSWLYLEAKDKAAALTLRRKNGYFFDKKTAMLLTK